MVSRVQETIWIKYPEGERVWTLTDLKAFIIVALVVLLITRAGTSIWLILMHVFSAFRAFDLQGPNSWRHAFYNQVVLPKKSPFEAFFRLIRLAYLPTRTRSSKFAWLLIIKSFIYSFGFLGLALASPWWLTYGTEEDPQVLANPRAGLGSLWVTAPNNTAVTADYASRTRLVALNREQAFAADAHYSSCYASSLATECKSNFVVPKIEFDVDHSTTTCPFEDDMCVDNTDNPAANPIHIVTKWISMKELNLNTKENLHLQISTTCAPIRTSQICTNCDVDDDIIDIQYGDPDYYHVPFYRNSTSAKGYRLWTTEWTPGSNISFDPRLTVQDGSVTTIIFNPVYVLSDKPSQDPLFGTQNTTSINGVQWWLPAHLVVGMACIDQMRVSNNVTGVVSPWLPPGTVFQYEPVFDTVEAKKVGLILGWASQTVTIHSVIAGRGTSALRASRSLDNVAQTGIAPNQTHEEVYAWFGTSLAKLALAVLSVGVGVSDFNTTGLVDFRDSVQYDTSDLDLSDLAGMVTFRDGSYSMLNVAGLATILSLGIVLWCIALLLDWRAPLPAGPAVQPVVVPNTATIQAPGQNANAAINHPLALHQQQMPPHPPPVQPLPSQSGAAPAQYPAQTYSAASSTSHLLNTYHTQPVEMQPQASPGYLHPAYGNHHNQTQATP